MTRRAPRRLPVGGALLLILALALCARSALADAPEEPWARGIREGIVGQTARSPDRRPRPCAAALEPRRQNDVVSLYLLARLR
jgi:hypothetical protein